MSDEKKVTAEEFIREKIRENELISGEMMALGQYLVNGEKCLRWSNEFATLKVQEALKEHACRFAEWCILNKINLSDSNIKTVGGDKVYPFIKSNTICYLKMIELHNIFMDENK